MRYRTQRALAHAVYQAILENGGIPIIEFAICADDWERLHNKLSGDYPKPHFLVGGTPVVVESSNAEQAA